MKASEIIEQELKPVIDFIGAMEVRQKNEGDTKSIEMEVALKVCVMRLEKVQKWIEEKDAENS